jgi:hypothetical protein
MTNTIPVRLKIAMKGGTWKKKTRRVNRATLRRNAPESSSLLKRPESTILSSSRSRLRSRPKSSG